MLAIIHNGGSLKVTFARYITKYLKTLCKRKLKHYDAEAKSVTQWATNGRIRLVSGYQHTRWAIYKQLMQGFISHRAALCDYLLYCASIRTVDTSPWKWAPQDSIPEGPKVSQPERTILIEDLCIPKVWPFCICLRH